MRGNAAKDRGRRGLVIRPLQLRRSQAGPACRSPGRWAGWTALLIGAASAPQAAMSGFHGLYTIPDTATAALGILLAVAVLATAGAAGQPGQYTENPCTIDREPPGDPAAHPGPQRTPARSSPPCPGLRGHCGGTESN
jgi:hypothetical protein